MSWIGQVGHVIAKDIRQSAWVIALVLVALGIATAQAIWVLPLDAAAAARPLWIRILQLSALPSGAFGLLVLAGGGLIAASLVHADSPARSDAFWVTRPIQPSAVLTAKLSLAALLFLVIPTAAQVLSLIAFQTPLTRIPGIAWAPLQWLIPLFGVGMAVAALTRDLRTSLVVGALLFAGWFETMELAYNCLRMVGPASAIQRFDRLLEVQVAVLPVLGLALAAFQYRVRDVRRTLQIFGPAAIAALFVGFVLPAGAPAAPAAAPAPAELAKPATLGVVGLTATRSLGRVGSRLDFEVGIPGAASELRYVLQEYTLTIVLPDGRQYPQDSRASGSDLTAFRPAAQGARWIAAPGLQQPARRFLSFDSKAMADSLAEMGGRIVFDGTVEVLRTQDVGRASLDGLKPVDYDDSRIEVASITMDHQDPAVSVAMRVVQASFPGAGVLNFSLVNGERREAVPLVTDGTTERYHSLVLPESYVRFALPTLRTDPDAASSLHLTEDWLEGAELDVSHWVPVGTYPIHAEVEVPAGSLR